MKNLTTEELARLKAIAANGSVSEFDLTFWADGGKTVLSLIDEIERVRKLGRGKVVKSLMTALVVGADVLLAWGISSIASIGFDRALMLVLLATVVEISYDRHSER